MNKKGSIATVVAIVLLALGLVSTTGYIVYDKVLSKDVTEVTKIEETKEENKAVLTTDEAVKIIDSVGIYIDHDYNKEYMNSDEMKIVYSIINTDEKNASCEKIKSDYQNESASVKDYYKQLTGEDYNFELECDSNVTIIYDKKDVAETYKKLFNKEMPNSIPRLVNDYFQDYIYLEKSNIFILGNILGGGSNSFIGITRAEKINDIVEIDISTFSYELMIPLSEKNGDYGFTNLGSVANQNAVEEYRNQAKLKYTLVYKQLEDRYIFVEAK